MTTEELLNSKAIELGFDRIGIASAQPLPEVEERLKQWLSLGYQGQMNYLSNNPKRRQDPREVLPGAKSVIVAAINYNPSNKTPQPIDHSPHTAVGRIARYAWGRDYHKVLDKKLKQLEKFLHEISPEPIQTRRYTDTGPVLEKAYAERAGIGFIGKNTLLISKGFGSWLFLGEILTTLEIKSKSTSTFLGSCGSCTRCLDACPTQAFTAPYQLDARKCIAYLTIEHRGPISEELQPKMDDWIFGCDICQEVCPYNRNAPVTQEPAFQPEACVGPALPLDEILAIESDEEYLKRFQGTPLMRTKRAGLQRNAAIAARNQSVISS